MRRSLIKAASAGTIGALLEWYDFYSFATPSALVFGGLWLLGMRTVASTWIAFVIAYNLGPTSLPSVQPPPLTRMSAPGVRYSGMSIAYQVSAIAGGVTPLVSLWLLRRSGGTPWPVAALLVGVAALSLACVAAAKLQAPRTTK